MSRYPKSFDQSLGDLARSLWGDLGRQPDLVEGSDLRSILEAVAFQVADLSYRQEAAIDAAVPEAIYRAFGFELQQGVNAQGVLTVTLAGPLPYDTTIPTGSEVLTDGGVSALTTAELTIAAGQVSGTVTALSAQPGAAGNVPALAFRRFAFTVPGVSGVTNPQAFAGGRDVETLTEQQDRFIAFLVSLDASSEGGLAELLLRTTLNGESLTACRVVDGTEDPSIPPGRFLAYCYRPAGITDAYRDALWQVMQSRRAAGALGAIVRVTPTPVDVVVTVATRRAGVAVDLTRAAQAYFTALPFGAKVSYENLITALTTSSPDVREVTLVSPPADLMAATGQHYRLGDVQVSEVLL